MAWSFSPDRPLYLQLLEQMKMSIVSGKYQPGDKLPAIRELALEAAVNPNTAQKAMAELEREELIYSLRTSGKFVTSEIALIEKAKSELARELIIRFLENMAAIGYSRQETAVLVTEETKEVDTNGNS